METADLVGRGKGRKKQLDRLRRIIRLIATAGAGSDPRATPGANSGSHSATASGAAAVRAVVTAAATRAHRCRDVWELCRHGNLDLRLDGWGGCRLHLHRLRRRDWRRWRRHDWHRYRLRSNARDPRCDLDESQALALIGNAARATMTAAAAARRTRTAGPLLLLDDRVMHRERCHEQHDDRDVDEE